MAKRTLRNEDGFILVWALLLMIVVTLLGAAGISTSIFEKRMAANEALYKQSFYAADGGTENALGLIIANVNCISGFTTTKVGDDLILGHSDRGVRVHDRAGRNFWLTNNLSTEIDMPADSDNYDADVDRDFHYPAVYAPGEAHTNIRVNGDTELMTGANLPMLAGYEGKGKALGADGAFLEYDIKAQHVGARNNRVGVYTKFRLDNQFASYPAGECVY